MKTDEKLQKDVQDAIKWEPILNNSEISVAAEDGIVTLTGFVDSYAKKTRAEDTAKNIAGVRAVVENIDINFCNWPEITDADIALQVLNAFKWNRQFPDDKVKVRVEHGWVTLEGELGWNYQSEAAKKLVSPLSGVKGVTNNIIIKLATNSEIEKEEIENAFERSWSIDDQGIDVKVSGNNVTLRGKVHSFYQKEQAGKMAWNAPGVSTVDNKLVIEYN